MSSEKQKISRKLYFLQNYIFKKGNLRFLLALKDGPLYADEIQKKSVKRGDRFGDILGITTKEQDENGYYYISLTHNGYRLVNNLNELMNTIDFFLPSGE